MTFPERLKQLRKEKGITQTQLAKDLNISGGTVAMWETGKRKPSFELLWDLADYFDKSADYILGTSDTPGHFRLNEEEIEILGLGEIQEEFVEILERFSKLDDYGKSTIRSILLSEYTRCFEQNTLGPGFKPAVILEP